MDRCRRREYEGALGRVYSLEEINVEKLVGLTDKARNQPRELYDLWHLVSEGHIDFATLVPRARKQAGLPWPNAGRHDGSSDHEGGPLQQALGHPARPADGELAAVRGGLSNCAMKPARGGVGSGALKP